MNIVFFQSNGFDYLTSQITEGLHLLSQKDNSIELKALFANTHHGADVEDLQTVTEQEAIDNINWADLILFSSGGNMTCFGEDTQTVFCDPTHRCKRVFIDGHDSDGLLADPGEQLVYFKRECRPKTFHLYSSGNIRSLTFGVYQYLLDALDWHNNLDDDWDKRDVDISFMAFGGSNPTRPQCAAALKAASEEHGLNVEVHVADDCQPVEIDRYHEILYRSKIGMSLPGAGLDTLRFWEVPAHGAILSSFDMCGQLIMRNQFEGMRHCLYFQSWQAMVELARQVVSDKRRWCYMRGAADRCVHQHSTMHRAQEMLDVCAEML